MNNKRQLWLWGGLALIFVGLLCYFQAILLPFLTGLLVAYAMSPAVRRLELWGISRPFGTSLVILSFFLLIALLLFIAIPFIQTELLHLASRVPQYGERVMNSLKPFLNEASTYVEADDIKRLRELGSNYLVDIITWGIKLLAGILTSGLAIANLISLIVITPIVAFYFLRDWDKTIKSIDSWLPRPYEPTIKRLVTEMNAIIGGFAKGQALVCLVLCFYYSFALTLIGLDFSIVVGIVIGVLAFIPYVGAIFGLMLSTGIALAQFSEWTTVGIVIGIFVVGQSIEGYFLIPYLVGDRIRLHPVWVIFTLLAGGLLYGFIGLLFALPVAAAIGVLVRFGLESYLKSSYYLGHPSPPKSTSHAATRSSS